MSTGDNNNVSVCANCGKEGHDVNNICNKCKQVNYCNATCKKKHRSKHKKECEKHLRYRLALEHAAELHDKELFKKPPPNEDCPICFLRLPQYIYGWRYYACCGKVIRSGCVYAPVYDNQGNEVDNEMCPFCRAEHYYVDEEFVQIERVKRRAEMNDPIAINNLGNDYLKGTNGYPQDYVKALEYTGFHKI